jgi:hypothetical protein
METGWAEADGTERAVDYSIVASMKTTPEESNPVRNEARMCNICMLQAINYMHVTCL